MIKRKDQTKHDEMISRLAGYLKSKGYRDIKADTEGFEQPNEINWKGDEHAHIPDISARKKGKRYVFEVETSDSITHDHTQKQWRIFAAYAYQSSGIFCVVVPKGFKIPAQQRLDELNLPGKVLEV